MWGNKQEQQNTPSASPSPGSGPAGDASRQTGGTVRSTAWLGPSLTVKGQISGNEDLHIEGKVNGPISLGGHRLTVGHSAEVTADVAVGDIIVHGKVNGNIRAIKRLEIKKDGSVTGELTTASIVIEDGAHFSGKIEIHNNKPAGTNLESAFAGASRKD